MSQEILRRKSWDTESTPEELAATESLIARIKVLQTTQRQELSGVQIIAHFLRIHVQPIQARASPLWLYSGAGDAARIFEDLSVKDLEKLVRRFTSLSKKSPVPSSCRIVPFSGTHALPTNHQILSSLTPTPEGGDVPGRAVITDDSQEASVRDSEPGESEKSAGSSDKISESIHASDSSSTNTVPSAASPEKRKRKRKNDEDSGASKLSEPAAEDFSPKEPANFDPFASAAAISSDDEEYPELDASEPTHTRALHLAEKRAKELEKKLEASEKAREEAEAKAAGVAEKIGEMYTRNQDLEEDALLDTLSVLEMNCTLARDCLRAGRIALEHIFPHFFPKATLPDKFELLAKSFMGKDDPVVAHRQGSLKIGVEGTIALVIASGEKIDWAKVAAVRGLNKDRWTALIKSAKAYSKKIIAILDPIASSSASTAQTEVK
ncbi:hypothetical protein ACQ4PT_002178 [Festuca glaucescens]